MSYNLSHDEYVLPAYQLQTHRFVAEEAAGRAEMAPDGILEDEVACCPGGDRVSLCLLARNIGVVQ